MFPPSSAFALTKLSGCLSLIRHLAAVLTSYSDGAE